MTDLPPILAEFASYKITIQNRSRKTVDQYCTDLGLLFRYIKAMRAGSSLKNDAIAAIPIADVDLAFVSGITTEELYAFLLYTANERENGARARARKLSSIKGFYKYLTAVKRAMPDNPAKDMEAPAVRQGLPKFLSLDESVALLDAIREDTQNPFRVRDYCIITLFLNCGMRVSELVGINLADIERDLTSLRVIGKGSKERLIYLNSACRAALTDYLTWRAAQPDVTDKNALFISRLGKRMGVQAVQLRVYKYLDQAGLGYKHYSAHKLRHTAATLMYQTGQVDVRVLKDILGHEQLNTTQIYTHVSDAQMQSAMEQNPLALRTGGTDEQSGQAE